MQPSPSPELPEPQRQLPAFAAEAHAHAAEFETARDVDPCHCRWLYRVVHRAWCHLRRAGGQYR